MPFIFGENDTAEYMGLFGFTWEEKVAAFIKKQLKGTAAAKKLSSFFQAGGLNVELVKNMFNEYAALMVRKLPPASFSVQPDANGNGGTYSQSTIDLAAIIGTKTNIDTPVILAFLRALFVLARDGKIPFAKWNPEGWKESTSLRKSYSSEKTFLDTAGRVAEKTANTSKIVLLVIGIGAAAYLLSQLKTFSHIK